MFLKIIVEILILCAIFVAMIFAFVAKDRKGGLHWYPKAVQHKAVERKLVSEKYIAKRGTLAHVIGILMIAFLVLGSVFGVNRVQDWWEATWQIYLMLFVMNLFDAVFVDWIWVRKTKYWVIPELSDLEIAKPLDYLLKERIIAAVIYIPIAAIIGCIALVL